MLNISPNAVKNLVIDNNYLKFYARFGGLARQVTVPMFALVGIYAEENGEGLIFEKEKVYDSRENREELRPTPLKLIK